MNKKLKNKCKIAIVHLNFLMIESHFMLENIYTVNHKKAKSYTILVLTITLPERYGVF